MTHLFTISQINFEYFANNEIKASYFLLFTVINLSAIMFFIICQQQEEDCQIMKRWRGDNYN